MSDAVHRACHAKINLALAVGCPARVDSADALLHPICSWMTCIDLCDQLTIKRANGPQSTYVRRWANGTPVDWPEEADLAVRAHRVVERLIGHPLPIDLDLHKSIPAGGGLGGGSSNAAQVMLGLVALFDLDLPLAVLQDRAFASLGSDVPFWIDDVMNARPAVVSAFGNVIERVRPCPATVVLILPPFGCETGAVYRVFDELGLGPGFSNMADRIRDQATQGNLTSLVNDLQPAAEHLHPALAIIRHRLQDALGQPVSLSGSGSTMFLLNPKADMAMIEQLVPDCRVIVTKTL